MPPPTPKSDRDPLVAPFDDLIGAWSTESTHPQFEGVVPGRTSYEWLEGGRFVVVRSHHEHQSLPDAISVIGRPESGEGLVMEYFDSRGVRRTYGISLQDGVLRWWREHLGFDQRARGELAPDAFELVSQLARRPGEWHDDLRTTYRRTG